MKGFSLLEIIITISILMILLTTVISNFGTLQRTTVLKTSTEEVAARVRDAQHRSLSGSGTSRTSSVWGMSFEKVSSTSYKYILFRCNNAVSTEECTVAGEWQEKTTFFTDQVIEFSPATFGTCSLTPASPNGTSCQIFFKRIDGKPIKADGTTLDCSGSLCQIGVKLIGETRTNCVKVNTEGRVTVATGACT